MADERTQVRRRERDPAPPVEADLRLAKWEAARPITVDANVWLGGGVIVLAGVDIGENTVVGAGSVVTRSLPADVVAVGSPARLIRSLWPLFVVTDTAEVHQPTKTR